MIDVVPVEDPAWATFVASHKDATCFHRPEWARLLMDCYGYSGFVVLERDSTGAVVGGMPVLRLRQLNGRRRWACLPFSDECGPLVSPGATAARLVTAADSLRRDAKADHLEVRALVPSLGEAAAPVGVVHSRPLEPDPDSITRGFSSAARRSLRKAQREGVEVRSATGVAECDEYFLLHTRTRRRLGVPVQPRRYFRLLWKRILGPGHGVLLLARHRGTVVAGAIFLKGSRGVTYKYGASDPEHWPLRPNHLIMWQAMTWAGRQGYSVFDWGRSDTADTGLRDFKSSLGGQERVLLYTRFPGESGTSAGRLRGPTRSVISRSPPWVARAAGALLYRYAG